MNIFLVGGHGTAPGAIGSNGRTERSYIEELGKEILNLCKKNNKEVIEVGINTRATLTKKTKYINSVCKEKELNHANLRLIELHFDWKGAKSGIGAYHFAGSEGSRQYAFQILNKMSEATGLSINYNKPDTSSRHKRLGIIRDTKPLAILIECGSLGKDIEFLENGGIEKLARGIFIGIYGESPKEEKNGITEKQRLKIRGFKRFLGLLMNQGTVEERKALKQAINAIESF